MSRAIQTHPPRRASAHLGSILRGVLVSPRGGLEAALAATERRARTEASRPEGLAPYVLSMAGGAAAMIVWLKLGGLLGLRNVQVPEVRWSDLGLSLLAGALLALAAQLLWGAAGKFTFKRMKAQVRSRDLRIVWGAAALPQAIGLVVLLPLDLLIVGTKTFATVRLADPVSTGWAAISIAVAVALMVWSLFIFVRGMQLVGHLNVFRGATASIAALACTAVLTVIVATALMLVAGMMA